MDEAVFRASCGLLFLFHPFACSQLRPRHREESLTSSMANTFATLPLNSLR